MTSLATSSVKVYHGNSYSQTKEGDKGGKTGRKKILKIKTRVTEVIVCRKKFVNTQPPRTNSITGKLNRPSAMVCIICITETTALNV